MRVYWRDISSPHKEQKGSYNLSGFSVPKLLIFRSMYGITLISADGHFGEKKEINDKERKN